MRCSISACNRVVLLSLITATVAGCAGKTNEYQAPPPPPVTITQPVQRPVQVYLEQNGETEVTERAEVRARVTGFLKAILFEPGDKVFGPADAEAGSENSDQSGATVLYLIEPDQYQATKGAAEAALKAAESAIVVAEAQVNSLEVEAERATREYERQERLKAQDATTEQTYDAAVAARDAAVASVAAAKANVLASQADRDKAEQDVVQANLDLSYTTVTAPIDGRITKTEVKLGNLVEEGTHLATVVNRDQMYVNFNLSDVDFLLLQQEGIEERREQGKAVDEEVDLSTIRVELQREIDEGFPFVGHLDYADQEGVDQATGTFALRGVFENPAPYRIVPGLFVRVRVPIGDPEEKILIPEAALARNQLGPYVQVVDAEGMLAERPVVTGQVVPAAWNDGEPAESESSSGEQTDIRRMVVIEEGLSLDDRVIINGGYGVLPGTEVEVVKEESLDSISLIDASTADGAPGESPDAASENTDSSSETPAPASDE